MPKYNTNLWTGSAVGLKLSGVFPAVDVGGTDFKVLHTSNSLTFPSQYLENGGLHSVTSYTDVRDDCRKFLWGVLEQFHTAFTGGANTAVTQSAGDEPVNNSTGSGTGKVTKMTVAKSSLSLVDEDTAKTTFTVVFQYAVDAPGATNLEVEAE